jgi:hypothetical protein
MAIVFADKVKVRSTSTGTAEFTLEATLLGFQSFAAIGAGNECYYGIEDAAGNWEVGRGTYDTDSTQELLFRDTVISSSNSNNLVNFPAGGKTVFVTIPSSVASSIVDNAASDSFKTISVSGQSNVVADSSTDTLTLVAGAEIDITTNATNDSITIATDLSAVSQNILPSVDSDGTTGYTLGSPSFKWKELFVSNGSIYIGDVKLSNVAGKLAVTKVVNPGEVDEEEDPEDSDAASELGSSGGAAVVERGVVFPDGIDGDVAGVLANDEGVLYLSTADWADANDVTKEFNITNASEFAVSQTAGLYNGIDASFADFPELIDLFILTLNQNLFNPTDWTIDAGVEFGGPRVCYNVSYDSNAELLTFQWIHDAEDPTSIAVDYPATVTYTGTLAQPGIWKRFIAADKTGTQILTDGGEIVITAQETSADQGDGVIVLLYSPDGDSISSFNSTLELSSRGINLDVDGNDVTLERDGLDFDSGYKLARSQGREVLADSTDTVYVATNYNVQVIKLIIKAQEDSGTFQACEMMIVSNGSESPTVNYTVYGLVHTGEGPIATFSADWDATAVDEEVGGRIVVSATNLSSTDRIWVETMAIEMTQWD